MTARFRYRAATPDGQLVEGVLQAESPALALDELRRQRLFPVDVSPAAEQAGAARSRGSLGLALAVWARTLAALLDAGLPLDRALRLAERSRHTAMADAARQVREAVEGGAGLAGAMRALTRVFTPLAVAMVAAGEESGALGGAMGRLADHLDEAGELRAQVRSALLYPALMAVVATLGVVVLLLFVVPRFVAMLAEVGGQLPMSTRALVAVSAVVTGWWWIWLPALATAVAGARAWVARPDGRRRWHQARLRLPVVGELERTLAAARFTRTLGLLLASGVGILPALRVARTTVGNELLREGLERAAAAVAQGRRLAAELDGVLPPLAVQLVDVGEESGQLDALCLRAADAFDAESRRSLRAMVSLLEPALILVFGALVGFVALAMLQAIYSINASTL
jgi:general secretion pathway protein F